MTLMVGYCFWNFGHYNYGDSDLRTSPSTEIFGYYDYIDSER